VIPVSFVVLVLGIALLAVSPIMFIASGVGWVLELSIKLLNVGVFVFEDLPLSLINGVYINTLQCWLLMGFVLAWILFFEFRKFRFVIVSLVLITLFSFFCWQHYFRSVERRQWVVYCVPGHAAMEWIAQGKSILFSDSLLRNDNERMRFHIYPNRLLNGVSQVDTNTYPDTFKLFPGFAVFYWNGKSVLWIKDGKHKLPDSIRVDYVLVSNRAVRSVKELYRKVDFSQLILDSSNSIWYSNRMVNEALMEKIPIHSVLHQGAFVVTM
jgi:competence protein ComEC